MRLRTCGAIALTAFVLLLIGPAMSQAQVQGLEWTTHTNKTLPNNVIPISTEKGAGVICRVTRGSDQLPGELDRDTKLCHVVKESRELTDSSYELLLVTRVQALRWVRVKPGEQVPGGAVPAGRNRNNAQHICRAAVSGTLKGGRLARGICHIPARGRDAALKSGYHVLVSEAGGRQDPDRGQYTPKVTGELDCSKLETNRDKLWPPDHDMVRVRISGGRGFVIEGIYQDECVEGCDEGDEAPDGEIARDARSCKLRSERNSYADGRVYHIMIKNCPDPLKVEVPLTRSGDSVDQGPLYDSTTIVAPPGAPACPSSPCSLEPPEPPEPPDSPESPEEPEEPESPQSPEEPEEPEEPGSPGSDGGGGQGSAGLTNPRSPTEPGSPGSGVTGVHERPMKGDKDLDLQQRSTSPYGDPKRPSSVSSPTKKLPFRIR